MTMLKKLCFYLLLATLFLAGRADDIGGIRQEIGEVVEDVGAAAASAYQKLPPPGRFAVGAGVGFVGSRVAVNTAVSAVKVAGAAFIVSEGLNYAGAFDGVSNDSKAFLGKVKSSTLKSMKNLRSTVRKRVSPGGIRNTIEAGLTNEKMATMGVAAGAFAGLML